MPVRIQEKDMVKKVLMVLALMAGFLVSAGSPPAQAAVNCTGNWITRTSDWVTFETTDQPYDNEKGGTHRSEVDFMWCYPDNDDRFVKVREYRVRSDQDSRSCGMIDEWHYDPNALNWWNAPSNSINCLSDGGVRTVSFDPDSTTGTVNVYSHLPRNERCIGSEAKAGVWGDVDEQVADPPSVCFLD